MGDSLNVALACLAGALMVLAFGMRIGARLERLRVRRVDEASQFMPGDRVTFGDGSYVVVASVAERHSVSEGKKR